MKETTRRMLRLATLLLMVGFGLLAAGCYTVEGVGHDISAAGQTLADWAEDDEAK